MRAASLGKESPGSAERSAPRATSSKDEETINSVWCSGFGTVCKSSFFVMLILQTAELAGDSLEGRPPPGISTATTSRWPPGNSIMHAIRLEASPWEYQSRGVLAEISDRGLLGLANAKKRV
jgi:hypothetical protein